MLVGLVSIKYKKNNKQNVIDDLRKILFESEERPRENFALFRSVSLGERKFSTISYVHFPFSTISRRVCPNTSRKSPKKLQTKIELSRKRSEVCGENMWKACTTPVATRIRQDRAGKSWKWAENSVEKISTSHPFHGSFFRNIKKKKRKFRWMSVRDVVV